MAATSAQTKPAAGRSWLDFRSKKTEANPKNTLFGSVLERQDKESLQQLEKIDVKAYEQQELQKKEQQRRRARAQPELPEHLKKNLPGDEVLLHTKDELKTQKTRAERLNEVMDTNSQKALNFEVRKSNVRSPFSETSSKPHHWIKEEDIQHAAEINRVGLGSTRAYNRDKHGDKGPAHRYALIGDPLRKDMDFNEDVYGERASTAFIETTAERLGFPSFKLQKTKKDVSKEANKYDLPQNIRHQFGSKEVDRLLADQALVKRTLEEQELQRKHLARARSDLTGASLKYGPIDPAYESLSNSVRQNICPGYTFPRFNISHNKEMYNDNIFKTRYSDPDEYRMQKDELGRWAEYNVIREKMKKAYDQYLHEILASKQTTE
ncbi:uncharacterized protein LOC106169449 isoform X2 [Lingula anatina]|uniref:Uncharacterized protein LOC106169449 isoform X2 n=1 Tax=Lingula anatina TaxID=7574 RepID=A0A1S3J1R5_LINAN|nr:uncharacterized protein LOC106169449 isoform X2 [Lingula anatina]|eukprot:XP_013404365.1 uncharacterized protein LOC106169449 isoform X2 [Lingula anatina]